MVSGDDLLNIGFYKINDRWFKWESSCGKINIFVYIYDNKSFVVDLIIYNYYERNRVILNKIKTLKQIQNLIKALEGEE